MAGLADMRRVMAHVYRSCHAHWLPIGVAPNIEVSMVVNPDDAALLVDRTAGFYLYEAYRKLARAAAGPVFQRRLRDRVVGRVRRNSHLSIPRETLQHRRFIAHRDIDDTDEHNGAVLLARVMTALEQRQTEQLRLRNGKALQDGLSQRFGRVAERQWQLCNADQAGFLAGKSGRGLE